MINKQRDIASEPAQGDSGGGLFFNIELTCTNSNQGTMTPGVLGGVLSGWHSAEDTRARWAPLGHSGRFICDNLDVPVARTLTQQRSDAITAIDYINLNDRANVLSAGNVPSTISAGGGVTLGVEAVVGHINAGGRVWLRDRSFVPGTVRATSNIITQNNVTIGAKIEGTCTKFESFSLAPPFPAGTQDRTFVNPGGVPIADFALSPIDNVRDLAIRGGVRVTLSPGLYVFRNIDLASGGILQIPANTWIFLEGTSAQILRGDIIGPAGEIFWGIPNATSVLLGGVWNGAMVAPEALVVGDMRDTAILSGNFFVNRFTLHQGRFLFAIPFTRPWVPTCDANRTNCG